MSDPAAPGPARPRLRQGELGPARRRRRWPKLHRRRRHKRTAGIAPELAALGVAPSRLHSSDALREGLISIARRPSRAVMTGLGTMLGVGAAVATVGVLSTANAQVSDQFNVLEATQVTIVANQSPSDTGSPVAAFPAGAAARVARLNGVRAAGLVFTADQDASVATTAVPDPDSPGQAELNVYGAAPATLSAMDAQVGTGRLYDSGDEARADQVALVGQAAAAQLGLTGLDYQPAIFIDGEAFAVMGILSGADRYPEAVLGVVIPASAAASLAGSEAATSDEEMLITTAPGAANQVGAEAPYAIDPTQAGIYNVLLPPNPATLRNDVESTTSTLVLLVAALAFITGIVAISDTTLLAVVERVPEIGLRRALGARPRHVAATTLVESAAIGAVGAILGDAAGILVTTGVAFAKTWSAVLDPAIMAGAPLAGLLAGLVAGAYPAWRATRIQPVVALQR